MCRSMMGLAMALLAACAASSQAARAQAPGGEAAWDRFRVELALLPFVTVQQVEGPARDDLQVRDVGFQSFAAFGYAPLPWLEPAVAVRFDAGRARRAVYERPDATGEAAVAQRVEGDYWELWLELMVRLRWRALFAEIGWAPLILRHDASRVDLPNTAGDTDGTFLGSRAVAWSLGLGGRVSVAERWDLTLRLTFRIRYLVARGGAPLAGDEEHGQMLVWPLAGLSHRW